MRLATTTTGGGRSARLLWGLAILLSLAIGGAAAYKAWPLLYPQVVATAALDPACDLRAGPCTVGFATGGKVRLDITPGGIPVVTPLRLAVDVEGLDARTVEVDFAGLDMNMGYNRVRLEPTGAGRFEGQGMLPACVRNRMTWEAKVLVHTAGGTMAAPFRFETSR